MIADGIRVQIKSGELARGDKLPSTSELCRQHDVSAIVVRQAINALKIEGLVETSVASACSSPSAERPQSQGVAPDLGQFPLARRAQPVVATLRSWVIFSPGVAQPRVMRGRSL
ncbi:GntR family transcriptional regulator, partial [Micromonospora sp. NPDC007208]|uniref:GntR family transcriptional regulator n=1 Tax=Micromonospora sp. NPDC007208 TaxID=3364236 RepID=UPI0036C97B18